MHIDNHPKNILQQSWIDILRKQSEEAGQNTVLHPEKIDLIYRNNWLKALIAKEYGGLEWPLPQAVSFEEGIGWADGSAGWLFTLCAGAGWFSGFLQKDFANKIFSIKDICIAGSGAVAGVAKKINDHSYLINGSWKYATGAPFADVFTANCYIEAEQQTKAFCFLKDEVTIHHIWNTIGLIASSSESFSVQDLIVPKERMFEISADKAVINSPLYQYPFRQLAECTIAANISGMALHFIEECEAYFKIKKYSKQPSLWEHKKVQDIFLKGLEELNKIRAELHRSVNVSWEELIENKKISEENLKNVSAASLAVVKISRRAVNALYPYTGLTGASYQSAINKVWRDFQTGSQHAVFMDI
ncbi:MAG: hypothetical protein PW786_01845 [Arachidicoccus sp.]|nr:hypothetical protein [Arachidicoccus sp.]